AAVPSTPRGTSSASSPSAGSVLPGSSPCSPVKRSRKQVDPQSRAMHAHRRSRQETMSPSSPPADVLGVPPPFGRAPSDLVARRSAEDIREYADEIDATLRHGFRWQRFPSRLEALFELETENSRRAQLFYDGIVAIVVYVAFLLSDFYMIPDVMKTAVIVRLGVVTPLALLKLLILWW